MAKNTKTNQGEPHANPKPETVVKKNIEDALEKAALKKDLEAQKKAAEENLAKKQEATEKQFLARIDNMISSFETVSGWMTAKDTLYDVEKHMFETVTISFGDAAELSRRTVELLQGVRERFEAIEDVDEYKDFFDLMLDHKFNESENTVMGVALELTMLNIVRVLDGQLQEAYHFNEDAKEAIAKLDEKIAEAK